MGGACTVLEGNEEGPPGNRYFVLPDKGRKMNKTGSDDSLSFTKSMSPERRERFNRALKEPKEPSRLVPLDSLKTDDKPNKKSKSAKAGKKPSSARPSSDAVSAVSSEESSSEVTLPVKAKGRSAKGKSAVKKESKPKSAKPEGKREDGFTDIQQEIRRKLSGGKVKRTTSLLERIYNTGILKQRKHLKMCDFRTTGECKCRIKERHIIDAKQTVVDEVTKEMLEDDDTPKKLIKKRSSAKLAGKKKPLSRKEKNIEKVIDEIWKQIEAKFAGFKLEEDISMKTMKTMKNMNTKAQMATINTNYESGNSAVPDFSTRPLKKGSNSLKGLPQPIRPNLMGLVHAAAQRKKSIQPLKVTKPTSIKNLTATSERDLLKVKKSPTTFGKTLSEEFGDPVSLNEVLSKNSTQYSSSAQSREALETSKTKKQTLMTSQGDKKATPKPEKSSKPKKVPKSKPEASSKSKKELTPEASSKSKKGLTPETSLKSKKATTPKPEASLKNKEATKVCRRIAGTPKPKRKPELEIAELTSSVKKEIDLELQDMTSTQKEVVRAVVAKQTAAAVEAATRTPGGKPKIRIRTVKVRIKRADSSNYGAVPCSPKKGDKEEAQ